MLATVSLPFSSPCHAGPLLLSKHSPFCFHVGVCMSENLDAAFLSPKYLNIYLNFGSLRERDPSVFAFLFSLSPSLSSRSLCHLPLLFYSLLPNSLFLLPQYLYYIDGMYIFVRFHMQENLMFVFLDQEGFVLLCFSFSELDESNSTHHPFSWRLRNFHWTVCLNRLHPCPSMWYRYYICL